MKSNRSNGGYRTCVSCGRKSSNRSLYVAAAQCLLPRRARSGSTSLLSPRSNSTAADPLQQILAATLATQRTVEALGGALRQSRRPWQRPTNVVDLESDDRAQCMSWQASRLSFDATSSAPRVPNSRVSFDDAQRTAAKQQRLELRRGRATVPSVVAGASDEGAALPTPTAAAAPAPPPPTRARRPAAVRQLGDGGSVEVVRGSSSPAPPETTAVESSRRARPTRPTSSRARGTVAPRVDGVAALVNGEPAHPVDVPPLLGAVGGEPPLGTAVRRASTQGGGADAEASVIDGNFACARSSRRAATPTRSCTTPRTWVLSPRCASSAKRKRRRTRSRSSGRGSRARG